MKINFKLIEPNRNSLGEGRVERFSVEVPLKEFPLLTETLIDTEYEMEPRYLEAFDKPYQTMFLDNLKTGFCLQANTFSVVNTVGFEPLDIVVNKASMEFLLITEVFEDTDKFSAVTLGTLGNMVAVGDKKHKGDLIECYCSFAKSFKCQMDSFGKKGISCVELFISYAQGRDYGRTPAIAAMLCGFVLEGEKHA